MAKYYFVRHGESEANKKGIIAGWTDSPLSELGVSQAKDLANEIKESGIVFDCIFSSPLSRALDTARIIAEAIEYPIDRIIVDDDLREKFGGSFENRPWSEIYSATEEQIREAGGEDASMFMDRVIRAKKGIKEKSFEMNRVLLVAHSGLYKMNIVINSGSKNAADLYNVQIPKNADLIEFIVN